MRALTNGFLVVLTLVGLDLLSSYLKRHCTVSKLLEGMPLVVVEDGPPLRDRMAKARVTADEVLAAAHKQTGLERMDEIRFAILGGRETAWLRAADAEQGGGTGPGGRARTERLDRTPGGKELAHREKGVRRGDGSASASNAAWTWSRRCSRHSSRARRMSRSTPPTRRDGSSGCWSPAPRASPPGESVDRWAVREQLAPAQIAQRA